MIRNVVVRLVTLLAMLLAVLAERRRQFAVDGERGDENIKNVFYAVLAVTLAVAVIAAITAAVNGKIPLIQ